ncbi:hypothetical protein [Pseudotabrizicola sp. L79]|uniref:hypothetical protein n=1 Tax=Pseudotabrizicola sp. L79 TaxID=3118402 RepID=UPI002F937899
MAAQRPPLFLRPATYRRRRRRDAARLLPFVGVFLFLLPILWAPQQTFRRDTAPDGIYLFIAWAGLIFLTFLITRSLAKPGDDGDPEEPDDPGNGS